MSSRGSGCRIKKDSATTKLRTISAELTLEESKGKDQRLDGQINKETSVSQPYGCSTCPKKDRETRADSEMMPILNQ